MKIFFYKLLAFLFPNHFEFEVFSDIPLNKSIKSNNPRLYETKKLLTPIEISFYKKLKTIENHGDYFVFPQINMASIISKTNSKYRNELFRNIDFGIFNSDFEPLLLIELNDKSHKQSKRYKRDLNVRKICEDAGLKLMTFYTSYPNEISYVTNRILKEIKEPIKEEIDLEKEDI